MKPLANFYAEAMNLDDGAFLTRHKAPVLLHRLRTDSPEAISFRTVMGPPTTRVERVYLTRALSALGPLGSDIKGQGEVMVIPVSKRTGSAFSEQITVGRTRNVDIWLPMAKVSKLHAYFTPADGGARYTLTDAGSTNGTFVSAKQLLRDRPTEVLSGALVQFGEFQCLFFMPAPFLQLLRHS